MLLTPSDPRVRSRPIPRAAWVFVALAAGYVVGRGMPGVPAAAWFSAACLGAIVGALGRGAVCRAGLAAGAAALFAGWFAVRIHETARTDLSQHVSGDALVTLRAVVLETPRVDPPEADPLARMAFTGEPRRGFAARVYAAETHSGEAAVSSVVRVRCPERGTPVLRAGDRIRVSGTLRPAPAPLNPGEADRRLWAAQDGLAGSLRVPRAELLEPLPDDRGLLERLDGARLRWQAGLRDRARDLLLGSMEGAPPVRALLGALVLGEPDPALREVRSAFTRLGLAHVMAISGFHLAVMAAVALFILRLGGDGGWWEPAIVSVLVILYLAILPVQAPVWRAGLMVLGLLAADAAGRRYDRLALLAWIAVAQLLWRPMDLWSIGFQLSFGLVAVLMRLGAATHVRLWGGRLRGTLRAPPEGLGPWLAEQARLLVSANLLCCVVAAPVVAFHTGMVSPLAVVTGVLVVPLIVVTLFVGYAALMAGSLVPGAAAAGAWILDHAGAVTVWLVRWLDAVPGTSFRVPAISLGLAVAGTAVALYWFARGHRRDGPAWAATAIIVAWAGVETWSSPRPSPGAVLRLDALAVGDGTCHLLRSGADAMLWDCGSTTPGVGRVTVPRALHALGVVRVPTVVISHPNLDHFNGLPDVIATLGVRRVLVSAAFLEQAAERPSGPEAYVLDRLEAAGVRIASVGAGESFALGEATVRFLSPPPGVEWPRDNDRSLVASVTAATGAGPRTVLLTGDIESRAIGHLSQSMPGLRAAVMEAPHHGSARPEAVRLVADIDPAVVVQSTGPGRAGDARWAPSRAGRTWLTTATDGAVWVEIRRDGSVRAGAHRTQ